MRFHHASVALSCLFSFAALPAFGQDEEPDPLQIAFQEDVLYDVQQWFDGDDNEAAEDVIGQWDGPAFRFTEQDSSVSSAPTDESVVTAEQFYGEDYDEGYSRFIDENNDGHYETSSRYFDTNRDKLYDSVATYRDSNRDGIYEGYEFGVFDSRAENSDETAELISARQRGMIAKDFTVRGEITDTKVVSRANQSALFAMVTPEKGDPVWVDLGREGFDLKIAEGQKLIAKGPLSTRGDKRVLVAIKIESENKEYVLQRTGMKVSGTVESTRTAKVRGADHLVVKMKTQQGKWLTVDMGDPAEAKQIQEGEDVEVTGVPIQVGDRVLLIADRNLGR